MRGDRTNTQNPYRRNHIHAFSATALPLRSEVKTNLASRNPETVPIQNIFFAPPAREINLL